MEQLSLEQLLDLGDEAFDEVHEQAREAFTRAVAEHADGLRDSAAMRRVQCLIAAELRPKALPGT